MTDKIERGHQAEQLLRPDGILAESLAALEAEYIARWRGSNSQDEREDCWALVRLIDRLKDDLRNIVTTGQIAEADKPTLRDSI